MNRFAVALLVGFTLACAPQLRGECEVDETCPTGTRCLEGLCLAAVEERTDGGDSLCPGECAAGHHCSATRECEPDFEPSITILAPMAASLNRAASISVVVQARAPGGVDEVQVSLDELTSSRMLPSIANGPDTFTGRLDVPADTHGVHTLRATMAWSGGTRWSEVSVSLVARGPTITPEPIKYPRPPATGFQLEAFRPGEMIEVYAFIDDSPAGLAAPPSLVEGDRRSPGEVAGPGRWRFTVPARATSTVEAQMALTVEARDTLGNLGKASVHARVSRHAWRWRSTEGSSITAAPALVKDLVVFGDEAGVVTALRQLDGSLAWQVELDAAVVGHISGGLTVGEPTVHAVTRTGTAYWLDATDAPLPPASRVTARCPEAGVAGREPAAGASVEGDTIFVVSRDGRLQLMRRTAFTEDDGASACVREHALPRAAGVSSPSLSPHATGVDVYVATQDGSLHRVDVGFDAKGAPNFVDVWTRAASPQDAVRGAPALGPVNTAQSIVVGTDASRLMGRDAAGQGLPLSGKMLSSAIIAGPALVAGDAYLVDQAGEAQRVRLSNGKKLWSPSFRGSARGANARAGPVVGRNGNTCLVTGARLSCVTPAGVVNWSFDEPSGRTLDAVTPALGCDGRLFVAAEGGAIEAFDTEAGGPADGWSRPGGDARNTSNLAAPRWCDG